jgi:hypothetical protein
VSLLLNAIRNRHHDARFGQSQAHAPVKKEPQSRLIAKAFLTTALAPIDRPQAGIDVVAIIDMNNGVQRSMAGDDQNAPQSVVSAHDRRA